MSWPLRELTAAEVEGINARVIADARRKDPACQQQHVLLNPTSLQGCLGGVFYQSTHGYVHAPLEQIAGLLLYRIAEGQFFSDGNKRTAIAACYFFLLNNGYTLRIERKTVNDLLWGFARSEDDPNAPPRYSDRDAVQFIFDNIMPRS
jgi:Fic/DOC family